MKVTISAVTLLRIYLLSPSLYDLIPLTLSRPGNPFAVHSFRPGFIARNTFDGLIFVICTDCLVYPFCLSWSYHFRIPGIFFGLEYP